MELRVRNRERELASEKRAGAWLHRKRVEQQYRFLRRNPRVFAFFSAAFVLGLPLIWLQPEWTRGFWLGALTATTVWLLVLVTWQMSGVSHLHQGELAEQWTVQELRPLTKRTDWRLINHVLFRPWDIDHILLGPAGVIVIETKGGNSDWSERRHEPRLLEAVRQAANNAADTRRFLRPDVGTAPVLPVVALWPASESFATRVIDDVTVLAGDRLGDWLLSLPSDRLDAEAPPPRGLGSTSTSGSEMPQTLSVRGGHRERSSSSSLTSSSTPLASGSASAPCPCSFVSSTRCWTMSWPWPQLR